MKKIYTLFFSFIVGVFSLSVSAQNLGDLIDSLGSEISFGYNATQKITVKEISDQKVIIQSPIIKNQNNENITKYTLMYSEYQLTEILDKTDLLNQTKEKAYDLTGSQDPFTMELGLTDNIDPTKKYYLFIIPKDASGNLGEVSNEIRFRISDKTYGDAGSNETNSTTATHNAAGADMTLANITHNINGSTITLRWIAVNGSNSIDISVMTPGSSSFNRVATVNMKDESYSFVANRNGEYVFQFSPDNGGKQVNYTAQINSISETPNNGGGTTTTGIKKVPRTGPKENMIIILAVTLGGYWMYKKIYRKAK